MNKMLFTIALVSSVFAQAALLTFEQGTKTLEGVNLNKTAAVNDDKGTPTSLKMNVLGAGLRSKTVLFVAAKVYIAQLFSDATVFDRAPDKALTSLIANSTFVALKISMLRTVSASALSVSFREALQANGYAIEGEVAQLLSIVEKAADGIQGKTITLLLKKDAAGKASVYFEDTKGDVRSFQGSADIMTKIMAIWLGKAADPGLATLKTSLLAPVY